MEVRVKGTCLSWALDDEQEAGIWGGMTEQERRRLRRPRRRPITHMPDKTG